MRQPKPAFRCHVAPRPITARAVRGAFELRSIRILVLAGLGAVALPIAIALDHSRRLDDELARESEALLAAGIEAVREGRRLRVELVALERLLRQYRVVGDRALLELAPARIAEIEKALRWLETTHSGGAAGTSLARVREGVEGLERVLAPAFPSARAVEGVVDGIGELHAAARAADGAVQRRIDQRMANLSARLDADRASLLRLIGAMLALSLALGALFSALIARPIHALADTLKRLGNGDFEQPVAVRGPAEIARLADQLEWLRARLRRDDENRHDFLRLVSHELKTPLASLREGVSLLEERRLGELTDTQLEVVSILQSSVQRLDSQVRNVLAFSGLSQGVMTCEPRDNSLVECVRATVQGLRLVLARKAVTVRMPEQDVIAHVDGEQLRMILDNLLSNAVKHAPTGSTVSVELENHPRRAVLRVLDEGPGVPEKDRERVFSPFFKSTSADAMGAGTGIGLAVVRLCVRANGGDVEVDGSVTRGMAVRVTLPRGRDARAA